MISHKCVPVSGVLLLGALALTTGAAEPGRKVVTASDCSFQTAPEEFLSRQSRLRDEIFQRAGRFKPGSPARAVTASEIPRRNFIDDEIFGKLAERGIAAAPLSGDAEFLRRVTLDLSGRIPSPDDIRAFLEDTSPSKRDQVIERLIGSKEFIDRWTMWFGDLLQNNATAQNVQRQVTGRNAYHNWIRYSIADNKPLSDMAREAVVSTGTNYGYASAAGFAVGAVTPMGPIQDTYDAMLVKTTTAFLGMAHYDCLLCHSGRRHLDQISLWGSQATRQQAERMAAHFSRLRLTRSRAQRGEPGYLSYDVTDAPRGGYDLNTNYGNRPAREPYGADRSLTPEYHFTGATPSSDNWRAAFAESMVKDRMFSRNIANRLWKQLFGLGLVDPVDTLDPARLDPKNPPPEPWTLQATHPALLETLASELERSGYDLRAFLKLLVRSSAYQLSSRYGGEWSIDSVPLFARHYARRIEGEEVHDAIAKATGVLASYTVGEWNDPAIWAIELPEPVEPRSNGAVAAFMNTFLRGNRDTQPRSQGGSILQQLSLMNDNFVLSRIKVSASPALQEIARLSNGDAVDRLFLAFLSRTPTEAERTRALAALDGKQDTARTAVIEDLAWAAVNKLEFIFSY